MNYLDMITLLKQQENLIPTDVVGTLAMANNLNPLMRNNSQNAPIQNAPQMVTNNIPTATNSTTANTSGVPNLVATQDVLNLIQDIGKIQKRTGDKQIKINDITSDDLKNGTGVITTQDGRAITIDSPDKLPTDRAELMRIAIASPDGNERLRAKIALGIQNEEATKQSIQGQYNQEQALQKLINQGALDKVTTEGQRAIDVQKLQNQGLSDVANIKAKSTSSDNLTPATKTTLQKNIIEGKTTINSLDESIKLITDNPEAYSFLKGIAGAQITNRLDKQGIETRVAVEKVSAEYRKWLTGVQMSDKEREYYKNFLPSPEDNGTIVKEKLNAMKASIEGKNNAYADILQNGLNVNQENQSIVNTYREQSGTPKSALQEGQKSVSKSGKPIIYRNGQWEYE